MWAFSSARPLHKLTEAKQKFLWTEKCNRAYKNMEKSLISTPNLLYPVIYNQFILDTDWSNESVGAVLSEETDNEEHVTYCNMFVKTGQKLLYHQKNTARSH